MDLTQRTRIVAYTDMKNAFSPFVSAPFHLPIWYYSKIFYSFSTTQAFECLSSLFCFRQFLLRNPSCLCSPPVINKNSQSRPKSFSLVRIIPDSLYTFPQLRLSMLLVSPLLVISLLHHSWSLFFLSLQEKILRQKLTASFGFCPYHSNGAISRFESRRYPPKCLSYTEKIINLKFRSFFWKLELLLQSTQYFVPYMKLISVTSPSHLTQQDSDDSLMWAEYAEILGVWFDKTRQPVLATLKTCLAKGENFLFQELYWAKRITIKYQKKFSHKYLCPIPELLGYATYDVHLHCGNLPRNLQKTMVYVSLIQHQVIGPTFSEMIKAERSRKDWFNAPSILKSWTHFKIILCYKALQNVRQLGMLAVRHNNLCPSSFKIDSCTSKNCIKYNVKLVAFSQTTSLLDSHPSKNLLSTNPWFRSPELIRILSVKTDDKISAGLTIPIGRASDAWSTGLSLTCFLLGKDIKVDCSDIGPLSFDSVNHKWITDPYLWVHKVKSRLICDETPDSTQSFLSSIASTLFDLLVIPDRFERDISKCLNKLKQYI